MASLRHVMIYRSLFIFSIMLLQEISCLSPCVDSDFKEMIMPCDRATQTRKIIYYMHNTCDPSSKESIKYPPPIENIPCYCNPGHGKNSSATECSECPAGYFNHGGEIIDDWNAWNATLGMLEGKKGSDSYCSDFLTGRKCKLWKPSGDGDYMISGDFKNSSELRCFEQTMMVFTRTFVRNKPNNKISFEYKVDGASCRKGNKDKCSNGLYVYVNGIRKLKIDTQFQWRQRTIEQLDQGLNRIKFIYHKSCTRDFVLDVAYIRHLSFVGSSVIETPCKKCKKGTYSLVTGSTECKKCGPNTYQDEEGQTSCKKCPVNQFSRIGALDCTFLPPCRTFDYYVRPDSVDKCYQVGSSWKRNQTVALPQWPETDACQVTKDTIKPDGPPVECKCPPGQRRFKTESGGVNCGNCAAGKYSDGTTCKTCPDGHAAVPGYYVDTFAGNQIPRLLRQNCSGIYCPKDANVWLPRGNYMATSRIPGDVEIMLMFEDVAIDYHEAKVSFNCSIDCRMDANDTRLAKHDHCFLKFMLEKYNDTSKSFGVIREVDCVNIYRQHKRNGTIMQHQYDIKESGRYNLMALFHQEDEAGYSLLSYEARIYYTDVFGTKQGSAKSCTPCQRGTQVSEDGNYCVKCEKGTYSTDASGCIPCVGNTFADQEGSAKCYPCGSGTTSNARRDGCDYNGCTFSPAEGITYDLSPLKREGGSMYRVIVNSSRYYFPMMYFINICTLKHDNTSCYQTGPKMSRSYYVNKQQPPADVKLLDTMACKRWSFEAQNSYSIGSVLSFKPHPTNIKGGLLLELTRGHKCWSKNHMKHKDPVTKIYMECDLTGGVGTPEPYDNSTGIGTSTCVFKIIWRSYFACPLCHSNQYKVIEGECLDGRKSVTRQRSIDCRLPEGRIEKLAAVHYEACTNKQQSKTPLTVAIVISVLVILVLFAIVVHYAKRNRFLRQRIFSPGKSFSKVREDDEDELVDDISYGNS